MAAIPRRKPLPFCEFELGTVAQFGVQVEVGVAPMGALMNDVWDRPTAAALVPVGLSDAAFAAVGRDLATNISKIAIPERTNAKSQKWGSVGRYLSNNIVVCAFRSKCSNFAGIISGFLRYENDPSQG
jgi:hypothetical protein